MQTTAAHRPPSRPPKKTTPLPGPSPAFDWLVGAASDDLGQRAIRHALEKTPPEHAALVGEALAEVAHAGAFSAARRRHPPTIEECAKAIATLQRAQRGTHWEPVRRAISALLGTPVPSRIENEEFFRLELYRAHAFLSAVAVLIG